MIRVGSEGAEFPCLACEDVSRSKGKCEMAIEWTQLECQKGSSHTRPVEMETSARLLRV